MYLHARARGHSQHLLRLLAHALSHDQRLLADDHGALLEALLRTLRHLPAPRNRSLSGKPLEVITPLKGGGDAWRDKERKEEWQQPA